MIIPDVHSYSISTAVIARAIALRQERKMSLGDAIIAATALVHGHVFATGTVKTLT